MSVHTVEHADDQIISVLHDGSITWDELQSIKNDIWGASAEAIECYPAQSRLINNVSQRHLWRVLPGMKIPDLIDGWQCIEDHG